MVLGYAFAGNWKFFSQWLALIYFSYTNDSDARQPHSSYWGLGVPVLTNRLSASKERL
jgi:hypothetical protein